MINLQLTDLDAVMCSPRFRSLNSSHISVHGQIDTALGMLMKELQMDSIVRELQPFILHRFVRIEVHALSRNVRNSLGGSSIVSCGDLLLLRVGGIVSPAECDSSSHRDKVETYDILKAVMLSPSSLSKAAKRARTSASTRRLSASSDSDSDGVQLHGSSIDLATGCHTLLLSGPASCAANQQQQTCILTLQFHGHRGGQLNAAQHSAAVRSCFLSEARSLFAAR